MLIGRLFARPRRENGALKGILPLLTARGCLESFAAAVNPISPQNWP
jgi:hypothetical protein